MQRRVRIVLIAMLITLASRVAAYEIPYESWMGAYVGEKKIGYLSFKIDHAQVNEAQGYRIASVMNNRLKVLGAELTQLVTTVVYTDSSFTPVTEDFSMSSGGKTTKVHAKIGKESIDCVISAGSGTSEKSIPIPADVSLVGDAMFTLLQPDPEIGKEYSMHYFNPLTLAIDSLKVKVERHEKIIVGGKEYKSTVLTNSTPMGDMTVWQDDRGDVLQVKAIMGITMLRENQEQAVSGIEGGMEDDFAVLTSLKPQGTIINPRSTKSLDILISNLNDADMIISDTRQNAARIAGKPGDVSFKIAAKEFNREKSLVLPIDPHGHEDSLAATPYIDHDLKIIREQSGQIVGEEKNAYDICSKIRSWIYTNLKTRADIGITRSASDVLKSKVGVCRDYGILFAALARSAGVPSRIAAGLLYTDNAFYYHVWVECYVGEWVAFDATLPTDFVDATHIKLAEGDATSMFGLSRVIGSLEAQIKDYD